MDEPETPRRLLTARTHLREPPSSIATDDGVEDRVESMDTTTETAMELSMPACALQLERICCVKEQCFQELNFVSGYAEEDKEQTLTVTQQKLYHHPPFGYTSRIHMWIKGNQYSINILSHKLQSGTISSSGEVHNLCRMFSDQSQYKFCPGLEWEFYEERYHSVIRYHPSYVRYCTAPFQRVDSVKCKLWYQLPANASLVDKSAVEVLCSFCKRLKTDLDWQLQRTSSESPSVKVKRQAPSSRAKLTYMSPASQLKRRRNALTERNNDKKKTGQI